MSEKHTPGPWKVRENGGWMKAIEAREDWLIYSCGRDSMGREEIEANARLIAAAPDLLDALECLKRELILSDVDMDYIESHFRLWLNKAESAVAKARGYLFSPMPDKARGAS